MSELPTPISDQDKLLSNIAIGTPDIDDLIPNSRQEVYLKYIALNGIHELPVSISQGGTGGATSEEARTNLEVMKAHILYHNDLGSEGTITLSDDVNNYEFIDIISWDFVLNRIYELNNRPVGLIRIGGWGENHIEWFSESITLTGNSITRNGCTYVDVLENGTMTFDYSRKIPIRSVIGYKY